MKNIIVSYQKEYGKDGTCYTQKIKTTKEIIKKFNSYVEEIRENLNEKFVLSNEDFKTLLYLDLLLNDKNYIKLTTLDYFMKFYLKELYEPPKKDLDYERIKNRNTIIQAI